MKNDNFVHPFQDYAFECEKCGGKVVYEPEEFCHICTNCRTAYRVYDIADSPDD